jgi:hypothetical protein
MPSEICSRLSKASTIESFSATFVDIQMLLSKKTRRISVALNRGTHTFMKSI